MTLCFLSHRELLFVKNVIPNIDVRRGSSVVVANNVTGKILRLSDDGILSYQNNNNNINNNNNNDNNNNNNNNNTLDDGVTKARFQLNVLPLFDELQEFGASCPFKYLKVNHTPGVVYLDRSDSLNLRVR